MKASSSLQSMTTLCSNNTISHIQTRVQASHRYLWANQPPLLLPSSKSLPLEISTPFTKTSSWLISNAKLRMHRMSSSHASKNRTMRSESSQLLRKKMLNWVPRWSGTEDSCRSFHKSSTTKGNSTKTTWEKSIRARQMGKEASVLHVRLAGSGALTVKAQSGLSIPMSLTRSQLCSTLTELSAFYKPLPRFRAARKLLISWKRPSRNWKAWYPSQIARF